MDLFIIILCCILIGLQIWQILSHNKTESNDSKITALQSKLEQMQSLQAEQNKLLLDQMARQNETIIHQLTLLGDSLRNDLAARQGQQQQSLTERLTGLEAGFARIRNENLSVLEKIFRSNAENMEKIRHDTQQSLDKINGTVNEKLQKTLDERIAKSFEAVNQRLTEVYEGLGEMKAVASGVSDLKNVLSNVKTRGIMGEIQLGAILNEILAPEQYAEQVSVTKDTREKVDFAVRLPGAMEGDSVYLPIDSKFPGDTYAALLSAYESGDSVQLKQRRNALEAEIKRCAKSIRDLYINPPDTTDFAIMFLPFEGLYAEVVNMGMVETLQREYKVNIAGPSTMAAMLNSLQMGFRTLAIQKKSGEVWKILEAAKKEFLAFEDALSKTQQRLRQADEELEKLVGTRTRAINRKLKSVALPTTEPNSPLELDALP